MSLFPFDKDLRNSFYRSYRIYNKTRKFKARNLKSETIRKIDGLQSNNPKEFWNLINSLKENPRNVPPVNPDEFLNHFKNLNQVNPTVSNTSERLKIILSDLESRSNLFNELDFSISDNEILLAIKKLKSNKSGGLQLITNNMLKAGQSYLVPSLKKLFNSILVSGFYPEHWSTGYLSPIFKAGDKTKPENYRGIAITGCLGKLLNSIFNNRLEKFLEKNNIISQFQIGFSKKCRTTDHMFVLKSAIDKHIGKSQKLYTCFIDFKKAFDSVLHEAIYIKLLKCEVGGLFYKLLKNMYSKSLLHVKVGDTLTNSFISRLGVRQGDVLSPNLFKLFINDLPNYFLDTPDPILLNDTRVDCLLYADDVVLMSSSHEGMQKKLDMLANFCSDWGIEVNIAKTKIMIFNKSGRFIKENFLFRGMPLDCSKAYKYLGVTFTPSGSFKEAKMELYRKALKAIFKLKAEYFSLGPGVNSSLHVFDHTIKSILHYGADIWGCYMPKSFKTVHFCDFTKLSSFSPASKMEIHFIKNVLGVHKKSSNFASISEVGRHPLIFDSIKSSISYFYRLENLPPGLLRDSYINSKDLHKAGIHSWYSAIINIHKLIQTPDVNKYLLCKPTSLNRSIKFDLKNLYIDIWHETRNKLINQGGKLRTYLKLKNNFGCEKYIQLIKDLKVRSSITKFKISSHKLKIESGRYTKPFTPLENRKCERCDLNLIEDEIHFFDKCPSFSNSRLDLFEFILKSNKNYLTLSSFDKLFWTINCENVDILNKTGNFIMESGIT